MKTFKLTLFYCYRIEGQDTFDSLDKAKERALRFVDEQGGRHAIILDNRDNFVEDFWPSPFVLK